MVSALLFACGGSDDQPSNPDHDGNGDAGSESSGGAPETAGSSGSSTQGGSSNDGGTASGGSDPSSAGASSEAGATSGEGGQPPADGGDADPPALEGDGITWSWAGKTYTVNKKMHNGFFGAVERVNISGSDTEDDVPPNMFTLHLMPNQVGTFQCKDYVTATDSSFGIVWQTFDRTADPPNPGFTYSPDLPCEFTVTRADKGDTAGDVFEGTFKVSLRFPGNGAYMQQDRTGIVGRMRLTKQ